ncbi:DUF6491 family protein [Euryhalocaulis caribicus]|uniref:DUF6491 family protein n=1 Tax=Euryhalocaulis caribicus TaxID=1161401 RepID=UPI0012678FC0|nr:DUF6491 family protein [Euryhalocaulis caribicus]
MLRLVVASSVIALFGCASDMDTMDSASGDAPQAAQSAERDCFPVRNVNGFSEVDDDTVRISVGANDHYEVDVYKTCSQLNWSWNLALESDTGNFMCAGEIAPGRIYARGESCDIKEITRVYPDAEENDQSGMD